MTTTINDHMFTSLSALHPEVVSPTLGDLLYAENLSPRLGSLAYYVAAGASGSTWSDAALSYWSDPDYTVSNLELEDGNDMLLEDGGFVLMEAGNG